MSSIGIKLQEMNLHKQRVQPGKDSKHITFACSFIKDKSDGHDTCPLMYNNKNGNQYKEKTVFYTYRLPPAPDVESRKRPRQ